MKIGVTGFVDKNHRFVPTGSAMGRPDLTPDDDDGDWNIQFRLFKMEMSPCGAYDHCGAYWGAGDHNTGWMYRAHHSPFDIFIRARSRREAKEKLRKKYPKIRFIN